MPSTLDPAEFQQSGQLVDSQSSDSRPAIDFDDPTPYYYQLERLIRAEIAANHHRPGDMIMSERQLCEAYGVSRSTVRQAIGRLVARGALYHIKGKGTFVAPRPHP
jgi:GntR family transcriptional regulator